MILRNCVRIIIDAGQTSLNKDGEILSGFGNYKCMTNLSGSIFNTMAQKHMEVSLAINDR